MAILKASKGGKSLGAAINYAAKEGLCDGVNCPDDPKLAKSQMESTKEMWGKTDGRLYKPYIMSFKKGEVTPELGMEIAREFAEKGFNGHEVFLGGHEKSKSGCFHVHMVVESVNFQNGIKIHSSEADLENLKMLMDDICKKYGLSTLAESKDKGRPKGTVNVPDRNKYQRIQRALESDEKGISHEVDIKRAIDKALERSAGKGMKVFQDALKQEGVTYYERSDKAITFMIEGVDGKILKATGSLLAKTFTNDDYKKENILSITKGSKEISKAFTLTDPNELCKFYESKNLTYKEIAETMMKVNNVPATEVRDAIAKIMFDNSTTLIRSDTARDNAGKIVRQVEREIANAAKGKVGGRGVGSSGPTKSRNTDRSIEQPRPLAGGGLTMNNGLSEDEQIELLMDKGLSQDLARQIIQNAEE